MDVEVDLSGLERDAEPMLVNEEGPLPQEKEEEQEEEQRNSGPPGGGIECIKLRRKLQLWKDWFPEKTSSVFQNFDIQGCNEKDVLEDMISQCRFSVGIQNGANIGQQLADSGLCFIENGLLNFTPVQCQGLHLLSKDPVFQDTIKEIMIEYDDLLFVDPKYRLAGQVVKTIFMLHHINSSLEQQNAKNPEAFEAAEKAFQEFTNSIKK